MTAIYEKKNDIITRTYFAKKKIQSIYHNKDGNNLSQHLSTEN